MPDDSGPALQVIFRDGRWRSSITPAIAFVLELSNINTVIVVINHFQNFSHIAISFITNLFILHLPFYVTRLSLFLRNIRFRAFSRKSRSSGPPRLDDLWPAGTKLPCFWQAVPDLNQ